MSKLDRWRVCKEETAMAGAAAAFLSISDLGIEMEQAGGISGCTAVYRFF